MRKLLALLVVALMPGCAGIHAFSPERWVENNTMYSTVLPSIEIEVEPSLSFDANEKKGEIVGSLDSINHTGKDIEVFSFVDRSKKKVLAIKIETLTARERWYMQQPDFSQSPLTLISGHETVGGIDFATGILRSQMGKKTVLIKAFAKLVGETTNYGIFYMEEVSSDWLGKYVNLFSKEDHDFIDAFQKRADDSFSVASFSGLLPPNKRERQKSELLSKDPELPHDLAGLMTMRKKGLLSLPDYLLGCSSAAGELQGLTEETSSAMFSCIDDRNENACNKAAELFSKNPWLVVGDIGILHKGEKDSESTLSSLRKMRIQYPLFANRKNP